jgi:hypothetical protein
LENIRARRSSSIQQGLDGRIILKTISEKLGLRIWTDLSGSGQGPIALVNTIIDLQVLYKMLHSAIS